MALRRELSETKGTLLRPFLISGAVCGLSGGLSADAAVDCPADCPMDVPMDCPADHRFRSRRVSESSSVSFSEIMSWHIKILPNSIKAPRREVSAWACGFYIPAVPSPPAAFFAALQRLHSSL